MVGFPERGDALTERIKDLRFRNNHHRIVMFVWRHCIVYELSRLLLRADIIFLMRAFSVIKAKRESECFTTASFVEIMDAKDDGMGMLLANKPNVTIPSFIGFSFCGSRYPRSFDYA